MTIAKKSLYLVVRYGQIDQVDAIQEIEKLVRRRGHAWFGKYGQPLSKALERIVTTKSEEVFVVLIRKARAEEVGNYVFQPYKVVSLSRIAPSKATEYPRYYRDHVGHIGAWLKVERYRGQTIDLKRLVIKSSLQPLPRGLSTSMRGHFLCRLWE